MLVHSADIFPNEFQRWFSNAAKSNRVSVNSIPDNFNLDSKRYMKSINASLDPHFHLYLNAHQYTKYATKISTFVRFKHFIFAN